MSSTRLSLALLAAAALPLAGCGGGLLGEASAPSPTVYDDVPQAAELTEERSQELYLIVVQNLRKEGQSHAALAYLDDYDMRFPGDPRSRLLRADLLVDVGAHAEAAAIYRDFLDDRRLAPGAYAGLGHVAAAGDDWRAAETAFAEAAQRQPVNAKYLNALGFAQLMNGDLRGALFSLRKANQLAPANATFRNNLVLALKLSGQEADAARLVARIADGDERAAAERMLAMNAADLGIAPTRAPAVAATAAPASGGSAPATPATPAPASPAPVAASPQPIAPAATASATATAPLPAQAEAQPAAPLPAPAPAPAPAAAPAAAPLPVPAETPQAVASLAAPALSPMPAGIATAESVKARAYSAAFGLGPGPIVVGSNGVEAE